MAKVLIIKTGRSETFEDSQSEIASLGDVLRTTAILHLFKRDTVSWITSREAYFLLRDNPHIAQCYTEEQVSELDIGSFDLVIQLESRPFWKQLTRNVTKNRIINLDSESSSKLKKGENWQQGLFRLLGKTWDGEEYIFELKNPPAEQYDLGLNWTSGPKWPSKQWAKSNWETFERLVKEKHPSFNLSWQRGFGNLEEYSRWIASCRILVTGDTLGLHLALALKKKALVLFGPTPSEDIFLYGRGLALVPDRSEFVCAPCRLAVCPKSISCMQQLGAKYVFDHFETFL